MQQNFGLLANHPTKEKCLVNRINYFCLSVEYKSQTKFESETLKTNEVISCLPHVGLELTLWCWRFPIGKVFAYGLCSIYSFSGPKSYVYKQDNEKEKTLILRIG